MQIGYSASATSPDPTTGRTPTENERIQAPLTIAKHVEEIGLDVFALGEHHNPPFWSSSPTTTLAYIAAQTSTHQLSTATTLITTNDPVKLAEDFAMLQHVSDGRVDLISAAATPAPCTPGSARTSSRASPSPSRTTTAPQTLARGHRQLVGRVPHTPPGLHRRHRARSTGCLLRVARSIRTPNRRPGRLLRRRLLREPHLLAQVAQPALIALYRQRYEHHGHGKAARQSSASAARSL